MLDARPWCSKLGPNQFIAKDVKSCTYCRYVSCATLKVWVGGMPWPHRGHSLPCTVRTSRQSSCNQRVGCLLSSLAMIYGMGLWTSARCMGLVPCCGQDGYQAQLLQHTIDTQYNNIFFISILFKTIISKYM